MPNMRRGRRPEPWTDEAIRASLGWPIGEQVPPEMEHNTRRKIASIMSVPDEQMGGRNKRKLATMAAGGQDVEARPPDHGSDQWYVFAHGRYQYASEYERDHPDDQ